MSAAELVDVTMCVDCAMWHANGDTSGMSAETEQRVTGADPGGWVIVGEPDGFSWRACDLCGTTLGGDRVTGWVDPRDPEPEVTR